MDISELKNIKFEYSIMKWIRDVSFNDFYEAIKARVIGQDEALEVVLAEVRAYLEGIVYGDAIITRSNLHNIIITASSGSGKTETYRALRDYFAVYIPDLPVTIHDVSGVTTAGFKGKDVADILKEYFDSGMKNVIGLCFLDELDKKLTPEITSEGINTNYGVQCELLTLLEGGSISDKRGRTINTSNMMFIGMGSFDLFRRKRTKKHRPIGIMIDEMKENVEEEHDHFTPLSAEDMISAGGSWELLGRFNSIINYMPLKEDAIKKVIDKTTQRECDNMGIDIELTDAAVEEIVEKVSRSKFGCRLIASTIHEAILGPYAKAMRELPEYNMIQVKINGLDDVECSYVPFTEDEIAKDKEYMSSLDFKHRLAVKELENREKQPIDTVFEDWI